MPSISSKIKQHNSRLLQARFENHPTGGETKKCNCQKKHLCPLDGNCVQECVIYKAEVKTQNSTYHYFGLTEGLFKERYRNHMKSFKNVNYRDDSDLSDFIWDLKEKGIENFEIKWSIVAKPKKYVQGSRHCDLCNTEKLFIIDDNNRNRLLNKRSELVSKCRRQNKYLLHNFKVN